MTRKRPDQANLDVTPGPYDVVELPYCVPRYLEALRRADRTSPAGRPGGGGRRPGALLRAVQSVRTRTGVFSSLRMPDLTDTWVAPALDWCRRQPPWDAVVSSSGPYTAHLVALGLKRRGHDYRMSLRCPARGVNVSRTDTPSPTTRTETSADRSRFRNASCISEAMKLPRAALAITSDG